MKKSKPVKKTFKLSKNRQMIVVALVVLIVAGIGISLLVSSRAASPDFTAVGVLYDYDHSNPGNKGSLDTINIDPKNSGDLLVLACQVNLDDAVGSLDAISGLSTSGWTKLTDITEGQKYLALWAGNTLSAGPATLTIHFSGSLDNSNSEYTIQEFQDPYGWLIDASKSQYNYSASNGVAVPDFKPTSNQAELYVGYANTLNSKAITQQSGWTYQITQSEYENIYLYDTSDTLASPSLPTGILQSPAGSSTFLAALIKPDK